LRAGCWAGRGWQAGWLRWLRRSWLLSSSSLRDGWNLSLVMIDGPIVGGCGDLVYIFASCGWLGSPSHAGLPRQRHVRWAGEDHRRGAGLRHGHRPLLRRVLGVAEVRCSAAGARRVGRRAPPLALRGGGRRRRLAELLALAEDVQEVQVEEVAGEAAGLLTGPHQRWHRHQAATDGDGRAPRARQPTSMSSGPGSTCPRTS
jgi:hypothetical protein